MRWLSCSRDCAISRARILPDITRPEAWDGSFRIVAFQFGNAGRDVFVALFDQYDELRWQ